MKNRRNERAAPYAWLAVLTLVLGGVPVQGVAAPAGDYEYQSQHFGQKLAAHGDLFSPWEADNFMLPLMKNHPGLFKGKQVLEVGTGVGIVSLYAAKLGAARVVATDIDPLAITYAGLNAEALGVKNIIELRSVPAATPKAFSVIKPGEKFDVIFANLPYIVDTRAPLSPERVNDNGELLMSLIDGLPAHLNRGGYAILLYRSAFTQQFAARYARMKGLDVKMHLTDRLSSYEAEAAFQLYMADLLRARGIDAKKMGGRPLMEKHLRMTRPQNVEPLFGAGDGDRTYYNSVTVISLPRT